jgi:uncharacterized protein
MTDRVMEPGEAKLPAPRGWLWAEFSILFLAVPAAHVVFFDVFGPFLPLAAVFVISAILLQLTPGFRWREVVDCRGLPGHITMIVLLIALCVAVTFGLTLLMIPERFLGFPRSSFDRYLVVIALYPFLSVLGQEIAYRLLFYRRYGKMFPNRVAGILLSAFVFALAHAFYMNWVAVILSFAGGIFFAWAYERTRSFMLVWILHSLAGQVLFTSGLGIFFYHGVIPG